MPRILTIEDEANIRHILMRNFRLEGYEMSEAENGETGLALMDTVPVDLVLLDYNLPGHMNGLDILKEIKTKNADLPVIMLTGHGDIKIAVEAVKCGAYDFLTKPFNAKELQLAVKRALQAKGLMDEVRDLRQQLAGRQEREQRMVGSSKAVKDIFHKIDKVAKTDFTVLVQGESGTGKEVVSTILHRASNRNGRPFIHVDCGIIPENLIESELFGHEKGAFTGADKMKEGQFELANGGTIFLDEIGNLPFQVQSKLLRVLQSRKIRRVGGKSDIDVDVRIIAATNEDLEAGMHEKKFRADLYYRLSEFVINIPPLAERKEDIPVLVETFAAEVQQELEKKLDGFSPDALQALVRYPWPGNVRELKNVVRNAILMAEGRVEADDLIFNTGGSPSAMGAAVTAGQFGVDGADDRPLKEITREIISSVEKQVIERSLEKCGGNKRKVAKALDIDYTTLFYKIKNYGIA